MSEVATLLTLRRRRGCTIGRGKDFPQGKQWLIGRGVVEWLHRLVPFDWRFQDLHLAARWNDVDLQLTIAHTVGGVKLEPSRPFIDVWKNTERINVCIVPRFDINGLPNAARGSVPMPLLPDRLLRVLHRILDPHDNQRLGASVPGTVEGFGDVELERGISPLVMANLNSIAPAVCEKVGGANFQNDSSVFPGADARRYTV